MTQEQIPPELRLTVPQLQALDSILNNTTLVPLLRWKRPPLSDDRYRDARGWEDCVDFIIELTTPDAPDAPDAPSSFVQIDRLSNKHA